MSAGGAVRVNDDGAMASSIVRTNKGGAPLASDVGKYDPFREWRLRNSLQWVIAAVRPEGRQHEEGHYGSPSLGADQQNGAARAHRQDENDQHPNNRVTDKPEASQGHYFLPTGKTRLPCVDTGVAL